MKKWLANITEEQYDWIKKTAAETGAKGADVVKEALDRCRVINSGDFRMSLVKAKVKNQLEKLAEEKRKIIELETNLQRQIKGEKVSV